MNGDHLLGGVIGYLAGAASMFVLALCAAAAAADEAAERAHANSTRLNPPKDVTDQEWMYAEADGHQQRGA
jgi:hypothetical protein